MATKKTSTHQWGGYGDDSPEKLKKETTTLSWQDQLKGLFNPIDQLKGMGPDGFADQILQREHADAPPEKPEAPPQRRNEFILFSREQHASQRSLEQETNALLNQLKQQVHQLESSQKSLSREIAKITVEQVPRASLGIYFLRYLEWLLAEVRRMRMKIEEGKTWLQEFSNKKGKKQGYWQKAKKHGTSFSMSNERTVATQSG